MKKIKRQIKYKDLKYLFKILKKGIPRKLTNNYRKLHKKPMRRKGGLY